MKWCRPWEKPDKIEKMESEMKNTFMHTTKKSTSVGCAPRGNKPNLEITIKDGKVKDYQYQRASTLPIKD